MFKLNSRASSMPWTNVTARTRSQTITAALDAKQAALHLHSYLQRQHWDGMALGGPDVGIRFNYRIGRFIKGRLRRVRWNDSYCYIQAQGYWILCNWLMYSVFAREEYRHLATLCSEYVLAQQREDGAWVYPNPEWGGRVATTEGIWGSLGLLESYRRTGDWRFRAAAERWYEFVVQKIGFQQIGAELAVNYFHDRKGPRVPNNSVTLLRFLAELADATRQESYLQPRDGLLNFLRAVQSSTGEFPYAVKGESDGNFRPHFQCYQYNAFACLDLMRYCELSGDASVFPMIRKLLSFLCQGSAKDGHSYFDCGDRYREVSYHTAVLAEAFASARRFGIHGYEARANRAYDYLLKLQRPDGSFGFSRRDSFLFGDPRSYPRNLAMILFHLLPEASDEGPKAIPEQIH
jgi:hypothetical protein